MPPACARRVAGMLRGLREPSLQDRTGGRWRARPGDAGVLSCPMLWLPAGFRHAEGGGGPPAPGRRQEKLVLPPLSLRDSKRQCIENLTPYVALTQRNCGLKSIPLESGTAQCPVPTPWGRPAPQANTWSFEQVTPPPSVCPSPVSTPLLPLVTPGVGPIRVWDKDPRVSWGGGCRCYSHTG